MESVAHGLVIGVVAAFAIAGILDLVDRDSTIGEFWQAFKDQAGE